MTPLHSMLRAAIVVQNETRRQAVRRVVNTLLNGPSHNRQVRTFSYVRAFGEKTHWNCHDGGDQRCGWQPSRVAQQVT